MKLLIFETREKEVDNHKFSLLKSYLLSWVLFKQRSFGFFVRILLLSCVCKQSQLMRNSPASLRRDRDGSDSRRSSGSSRGGSEGLSVSGGIASLTSPERECRTSDMSLQEKIKVSSLV